MHDEIVRFEQQGHTSANGQAKEWAVRELEVEMRDKGYVPSIDNEPLWTVEYLPQEECFYFILSVYGVKVGEDKSWDVSGWTNGKMIPMRTQTAKSKES